MKWLTMLLLAIMSFAVIGCEADADIDADDDGGKLKVDVDD